MGQNVGDYTRYLESWKKNAKGMTIDRLNFHKAICEATGEFDVVRILRDEINRRKDNHELKAGDVVQLKSGGPRMTIQSITADVCTCKWFMGEEIVTDYFNASGLRNPNKYP